MEVTPSPCVATVQPRRNDLRVTKTVLIFAANRYNEDAGQEGRIQGIIEVSSLTTEGKL